MSSEREREFEELLAFFEFYLEHLARDPVAPSQEFNLRSVSDRIAQEHGRSKALEGTRQAVNATRFVRRDWLLCRSCGGGTRRSTKGSLNAA